jgi:hypothetical protein
VHGAVGGEHVHSHNRAVVVDSFYDRYTRAGHVERRERLAVPAPQEAVAMAGPGGVVKKHIVPHYLTEIVDPKGHCPKHGVVTGHVDVQCSEGAVEPDEAVTFLVCIPVRSYDLALRVVKPPCDRILKGSSVRSTF